VYQQSGRRITRGRILGPGLLRGRDQPPTSAGAEVSPDGGVLTSRRPIGSSVYPLELAPPTMRTFILSGWLNLVLENEREDRILAVNAPDMIRHKSPS